MSLLEYTGSGARILDFDVEARPDAYLGGDLTTRSLTAIAAAWAHRPREVWSRAMVAGGYPHPTQMAQMLEDFRVLYDMADLVTGHNVVKYDLPVINGHMTFHGLEPLAPKMVCDTLLHGTKAALSYSRSMENMAAMYDLDLSKHHMNNTAWKRANTMDPTGVEATLARVTSDVLLHIDLRAEMLRRGHLKEAKAWCP